MDNMKYYNKSIEGSSHKTTGLPCQDFSQIEIFDINQNQVLLMAISDGHGSKTYVRSHVGSRLACKFAIIETQKFVVKNYDYLIDKGKRNVSYSPDFGVPQDPLISELFSSIHNIWCEEIEKDSKMNPFTQEEKSKLGCTDLKQAYGCTLMVCVKSNDFVFAYHLGDGRLFSISCYNEWTQPVPWDSACEDNITTSLCEKDPVSRFRYFIDSVNIRPFAIFMCSDGIEDCYGGSHDGNFKSERLIVDYSEVLRCFLQDEDFEKACCDFLNYQSEKLSHDDMSIAFVIDDAYYVQEKWLRLSELRRLNFDIRSKVESFSNEIKECENRISNINSNVKSYITRISDLESRKKKKENSVATLVQKQEEERACAESASRFNAKIGDFQTAIKDYCEEFGTLSSETKSTLNFRNKLIKYVADAVDNALVFIRKEIKEKRDSDSKCNLQIEVLEKEIEDINSTLKKEKADKEEAEKKLQILEAKKQEIESKSENFKNENSQKRIDYSNEAKKIMEEIRGYLPSKQENDTVDNIDSLAEDSKTVNICKMCHGAQDKDITITYSQQEIWGTWNGDGRFQIPKDKFDEIISKIKDVNNSLFEERFSSGDYVAILLPFDKSDIRYISLSEKDAVEIWEMCLALDQHCKTE